MRKIISALVLCTALGACAQEGPTGPGAPVTSGRATGSAPSGTTTDSLIGPQIGATLDRADQAALHQTTQTALETEPANQALPWRNANSGNYGTVTPGAVYQENGRYCREFQQTIVVSGQQQQGRAKACRHSDGSWTIVQ